MHAHLAAKRTPQLLNDSSASYPVVLCTLFHQNWLKEYSSKGDCSVPESERTFKVKLYADGPAVSVMHV